MRFALIFAAVFWFFQPNAEAEKRVALVIGVADYTYETNLANPVNDADDIAEVLDGIGFDVLKLHNAGKSEIDDALIEFSSRSASADISLVFFAGHGMQIAEKNYLIPADAKFGTELEGKLRSVSLDSVLETVAASDGLKIVMLDACRNNPFRANLTAAGRNLLPGLRAMPDVESETDTLIIYAAAQGQVADDGSGENSPFTTAILEHIATKDLEVGKFIRLVRDDVKRLSEQTPWMSESRGGRDYFLGGKTPPLTEEDQMWALVNETEDAAQKHLGIQFYIQKYPDGKYLEQASAYMQSRRQSASSSAPSLTTFAPVTDNVIEEFEYPNGLLDEQKLLSHLKCYSGDIDGLEGPKTSQARHRFQQLIHSEASDELSLEARALLLNAANTFSRENNVQDELRSEGGWRTDFRNGCRIWDPYIGENELAMWIGGCRGGAANGVGTIIWIDACKAPTSWSGTATNGKLEGPGRGESRYKNGELRRVFEGVFKDGTEHSGVASFSGPRGEATIELSYDDDYVMEPGSMLRIRGREHLLYFDAEKKRYFIKDYPCEAGECEADYDLWEMGFRIRSGDSSCGATDYESYLNAKDFRLELTTATARSGKAFSEFMVPQKLLNARPKLVWLVLRSESMSDDERQYWYNLSEVMTEEQLDKLDDILTREFVKLGQIDCKYSSNPWRYD